jgi:lipopolysaccharide/colanic/teichoic acid biosynthesis glycosyltransferase
VNLHLPHHFEQFGTKDVERRFNWPGVLWSNRFVLGGAFVLALVVPEVVHALVRPIHPWNSVLLLQEPAWFAAAMALIGAHIILRKTGVLPLVDDKMLILPSFLFCYGIALTVMSLTVRTFGQFHLITSLAIGIAWYNFIGLMRARTSVPRLALAGALAVDEDLLATRIRWQWLDRPRLPVNAMGLVFDKEQPSSPEWERVFSRAVLRNIPVYEMNQLREMVTGRVRLRAHPEEVFGNLQPSQPYLRVKRVIDTLVAVPALLFVLPLIGVLCLTIRLESPGSPIFRQTRVGYQGRRFTCYKLRTMRSDARGPAFTLEQDPRVTRFGRFLRKWRLDELPQLINILRGDMSWIGPRPEAVELARSYAKAIPFYAYRHAVRPGISGWAAMHQGNVALTDAATVKLEYDFYYLKYFSIWLDFLIVLMTIRTIVTGFGHR